MAFASQHRRGDDRWLEWKVRLFSVAAVLGLAGIYFAERWMTGAAILVLAGGIFLRLIPGGDQVDDPQTSGDEFESEADSAPRSGVGAGPEDHRESGHTKP